MSLILVFRNEQEEAGPLRESATYHVRVLIGDGGPRSKVLVEQHINHQRSDGWLALVQKFLTSQQPPPPPTPALVVPPLHPETDDPQNQAEIRYWDGTCWVTVAP